MFVVVQQEFYNYLGERGWDTTLLHGSGKTLRSAIESAEKTVLERFDERLSEVSDIDNVTDDVTDEGWTTLLHISGIRLLVLPCTKAVWKKCHRRGFRYGYDGGIFVENNVATVLGGE